MHYGTASTTNEYHPMHAPAGATIRGTTQGHPQTHMQAIFMHISGEHELISYNRLNALI